MNGTELHFTLDPAWPWSLPAVGLWALAGAVALLVALTVWTYLGVRGATRGRVAVVLALRLAALAVALLVVLRPSLGYEELEGLEPSKLLILVDASASMNTADDFNNQSRWDNARRLLSAPAVVQAFKRLAAEEKIEVVYYQGADRVQPFEPQGSAQAKQTPLGVWLRELAQKHGVGSTRPDKLRGVLLFSDGADTGPPGFAHDQARAWRGVAPVAAFGLGRPDAPQDRKDLIVAAVEVLPAPVPAKTKMTLKGTVHAPGFAQAVVDVSVWLQGSSDKEPRQLGPVERHTLKSERDNLLTLTRDAPETADEYKLTLKVAPLPGEADETNNAQSTYVDVTKDGVSVLWVDRLRAWEPTAILRALKDDRRFRVEQALPEEKPAGVIPDWYQFDRKHYDVIVIGDLSAGRFARGDSQVLEKVRELVRSKKTGLLMLGGYDTFAQGGWDKTPLAELLPVQLDRPGQHEGEVRVKPTEQALQLRFPFLLLDADAKQNRAVWDEHFKELDGMAYLGTVRPNATVLAHGAGKEPILVAGEPGGRVLVFGGDTTWKAWRQSPEAVTAFNKFWKQSVLWLARQDQAGGDLWLRVEPPRSLRAGSADRLHFAFGLRGKTGLDAADARFTYKVLGPNDEPLNLPISLDDARRGSLPSPSAPGEYRLQVAGKGKDPADGQEVSGTRTARFLVTAEDVERQAVAANHDLLGQLAAASGGPFFPADERLLLKYLDDLKGQARSESHARMIRWPDWQQTPASPQWGDQLRALWGSSALACFLAFTALLSSEWLLRRLWGLV